MSVGVNDGCSTESKTEFDKMLTAISSFNLSHCNRSLLVFSRFVAIIFGFARLLFLPATESQCIVQMNCSSLSNTREEKSF